MAYITPIRGLRYNPEKVSDLALAITPPYDVINAQAQEKFYQLHPYNIIRLEYGKTYDQDTADNNRYTRAAQEFTHWQEEDVLLTEDQPAIYVYAQEFSLGNTRKTRTGIMAGVKIEPYETGIILPHEETMPKHKADRLALMEACGANFSPIFSLYSDPQLQVETITAAMLKEKPDIDFVSADGQRHRLWAIKDAQQIEAIQRAFSAKTIFIADGHHRYETAMNHQNNMRQNNPSGDLQPYDFVMMTLVNLYDPGLVVLPTHRLVKNIDPSKASSLLQQLEDYFVIESYPFIHDKDELDPHLFHTFMQDLAHKDTQAITPEKTLHTHAFGLYMGQKNGYLLTLKEDADIHHFLPQSKSPAWRQLDVTILHQVIMETFLGIGGLQRANESNLTYTREELEAVERIRNGEYQMVFFMNPTKVEEVTAVAGNGEKMPQKSTFFYPKLPTGLLIMKL